MHRIFFFIILTLLTGCTNLQPKVRTCDQRQALDCRTVFQQFTRTLELDMGISGLTIFNIEVGAKGEINIDAITADYILHIFQLCSEYNNCFLTDDEYKQEMAFLRQEQLRIRNSKESTCNTDTNPPLSEEAKALFFDLGGKQKIKAIQRMLNRLGYQIDTDGTVGKQTKSAIEEFAQSQEPDGHLIDKNHLDEELYMSLWMALIKMRSNVKKDSSE